MQKFVRFVIGLLLVVGIAFFVLAFIEPNDITVVRTTMIKAPKEAVFEQMRYFKNWVNWSPWQKMDTGMKLTYYGTDGQPGSGYTWHGGSKTGAGDMYDSAINGTQMTYRLTFTEPHKGLANGFLSATDSSGMTKATWSCSMHFGFPWNAMCVFMNMDKLLGGDFEAGLNYMKTYVESHTTASTDVDVKEVDFAAHTYQGVRSTIGWGDMMKFNTDNYKLLQQELGSKIKGPQTGIYFTWDTTNKNSDMAVVFPVADTTAVVKGTTFITAGPAKAVMATLKGGYGAEMKYHDAIAKYMQAKGMARSYVVEEYVPGPQTEPDSNKWVTNIYYLVK